MTVSTATRNWQGHIKVWYQASRPRSLTATYIPVALGGVIAWGDDAFDLLRFLLALLGVLSLQISANLINEYYDHAKGSDVQKTHGLGMILARGALTPRQVLAGGVVTLIVGCLIGLYFVAVTGPLVLLIGVAGALVVVFYTAGPFPLAYIGLGEAAVFIFLGPLVVLGAYYVLAEEVNTDTVWASLPVAFLVADILHANNLRDLEADAAKQKRTLAVLMGRRFAQAEYVFLTGGAFVCTALLVLTGIAPWPTLAVFVLLPEAWQTMRVATTSVDAAVLHGILLRTARLHKWFGMVYVAAWGLAILFD